MLLPAFTPPSSRTKRERGLRVTLTEHFVLGVNEVTRGLESGTVCAIVICCSKNTLPPEQSTPSDPQNTRPSCISHLFTEAGLLHVPLCLIPRESEDIGTIFGIERVLAFGLKESTKGIPEDPTKITITALMLKLREILVNNATKCDKNVPEHCQLQLLPLQVSLVAPKRGTLT